MCEGWPVELNGGGLRGPWRLTGGCPIGLWPAPIGLGPGTVDPGWVPLLPEDCCCGFTCGGTSCASGKESASSHKGHCVSKIFNNYTYHCHKTLLISKWKNFLKVF